MMHHVEQLGITFKRMCNVRELKAFLKAIPHVQEFLKKLQFVPFTKNLFNPSRISTDRSLIMNTLFIGACGMICSPTKIINY